MVNETHRQELVGNGRNMDIAEVGTVKWFNDVKGFGFIKRNTGEDVFVHYSVIEGKGYRFLYEGQKVEFEFDRGPKGLWAKNVRRIPTQL